MKSTKNNSSGSPKITPVVKESGKTLNLPEYFKLDYVGPLLLAFLAFCLYANTFSHEYALDDAPAILNNPYIQNGIAGIPDILQQDFWKFSNISLGYYRPFTLITFAIEHELVGRNPAMSHVINVLLYAFTAFLLGLLLQEIFKEYKKAIWFLVGIIFVCHPLHTEVVANIKSRDEIFSWLSIISVMYLSLRYDGKNNRFVLALSLLIYYLGLLSKESAITLLAILPITFYFFRNKTIPQCIGKMIPFFIVMLLFFAQKNAILGEVPPEAFEERNNYPYREYKFESSMMLFLFFVKSLLFPYPLKYDYSLNTLPAVEMNSPWAILGLLLFLVIIIVSIRFYFQKKMIGYILALFLVLIIPALGFIWLRGGIFAERFLYTAILAFGMALVFGLAYLFKLNVRADKTDDGNLFQSLSAFKIPTAIILLCCIVYSAQTVTRNPAWKNNEKLFTTDIPTSHNSAQTNKHYGALVLENALKLKDDKAKNEMKLKAIPYLTKAVEINDYFGEAWVELGRAYMDNNLNIDSAIFCFQRAIVTTTRTAPGAINLGLIYQQRGANRLASYFFNRAIAADQNSSYAQQLESNLRQSTGLHVLQYPAEDEPTGFKPIDHLDLTRLGLR